VLQQFTRTWLMRERRISSAGNYRTRLQSSQGPMLSRAEPIAADCCVTRQRKCYVDLRYSRTLQEMHDALVSQAFSGRSAVDFSALREVVIGSGVLESHRCKPVLTDCHVLVICMAFEVASFFPFCSFCKGKGGCKYYLFIIRHSTTSTPMPRNFIIRNPKHA